MSAFYRSRRRAVNFWTGIALAMIGIHSIVPIARPVAAQEGAKTLGQYHVVHGWPQLPPGEILGPVAGVGVDSKDNVFVFRRGDRTAFPSGEFNLAPIPRPTVLLFDGRSGALLAQWGAKTFAMPHGLAVDRRDNVWLTDVAYHQVYKYSHDGRLLLTIGERGVPGSDEAHFNRPTDIAVAEDGSFYVSDGYRNSRVAKFAADGKFLFQWGKKGAGPGEFDLPHGIALDARGQVYVADRTNSRVQIFDPRGNYQTEWMSAAMGRPYDVAIGRDGLAVVVDGGEQPIEPPDRAGAAIVRADGSVSERFGGFGNYDGQFMMAHDVAVAADGAIYVGDITGGRVQKFVRDRNLQVEPDKENVAGSRLEGRWEPDAELTARLGGRTSGNVSFKSDITVAAKLPARYETFLSGKRLYLSGVMTLRESEYPFILIENKGNPHLMYFRQRNGDPFGDAESFNMMLTAGRQIQDDLLFIGGDFNNQPFAAYRRAKAD